MIIFPTERNNAFWEFGNLVYQQGLGVRSTRTAHRVTAIKLVHEGDGNVGMWE